MIYLAIGFPPAAKSSTYRMRATANQFAAAGWDVTVVTIADEAWERDYGLDHTLVAGVDPRVRVVKLPLFREDLETDVRAYTERRALDHNDYLTELREQHLKVFPEPVFGGWRPALEEAVLQLHRERPAELLVTTCVPYVNLAATWKLWETHRVPYVVDFRDGWSVDVINGGEAFPRDSVSGRWETKLLTDAVTIWNVNEPISRWYRERYPDLAHKMRIVRNGYDAASIPAESVPAPADRPLAFGYLGALNLPVPLLEAVLQGWRKARTADPALTDATFEVRGHIGSGWARGDNRHAELLKAAAADGVVVGGSVPKAEVVNFYSRWDVVVLMVTGGKYMTSGKVYEYMATGLPVVSAHEAEHDASTLLSTYPLWTGAVGLEPDALAGAFRRAADLARNADVAERDKARVDARQYAREEQLIPAVREVTELVLGVGGPAGTAPDATAGAPALAREGGS
ncbi:glycosyltransferase [Micromonospora sp. C51]|uniref:glycosyltransferase n=1 Tax=Micromonospora sp. C51 TaxID=2824879 RepID=UPI001FFDCEEA|nr:glycosyltransferase [Micromonospora sp. C51]